MDQATTCKAVGNMSEDIIDLLGPDKMYEPNLCQSPDDIVDISEPQDIHEPSQTPIATEDNFMEQNLV